MFIRVHPWLILICLTAAIAASADAPPKFVITTVAGTGKAGFSGDGGPATAAQINGPSCVAMDGAGQIYIVDARNNRVRRVHTDGTIETVVGTGATEMQQGEFPAAQTNLLEAYGLHVDREGNLYVFSRGHSKLFKVGEDGIAKVIAGTGERGYAGDGGPATAAQLASSNHMLMNSRGELIIGDSGNERVRKIGTDGIITTIAGTGEEGFGGDGGPATQAKFNGISAMCLDAAENLYIADFVNHRIRKIDTAGVITTIAGTGEPRYNGDGIPALQANIGEPCGVLVDRAGVVYIGDQINRRVRAVTPDGIMHTVAGIGKVGLMGDGGPATEARVFTPDILCFHADENIYIPDFANHAVRKLMRVK